MAGLSSALDECGTKEAGGALLALHVCSISQAVYQQPLGRGGSRSPSPNMPCSQSGGGMHLVVVCCGTAPCTWCQQPDLGVGVRIVQLCMHFGVVLLPYHTMSYHNVHDEEPPPPPCSLRVCV